MKFTDGNWMMRDGVRAAYAAEANEVHTSPSGLTVLAPTHAIRHRGDTLGGPVLTVRLSSPAADVVRVRISHFEGGKDLGPHFELFESPGPVETSVTEDSASLTSGALTAKIDRKSWQISFQVAGKEITRSPQRGAGYIQTQAGERYVLDQLTLSVGEHVYGLGERFTAFIKNGQTVDIWNQDGGTNSEQAYKNIPFYLTNRGYGVFVNHPGKVSFEVATEKVGRVQFSVPGESIEYFVIYGPTPKEILAKYTALTGRPALPPAWSFGLWLTTSFTTNYDEATVTSFIQGMADRDLPLHVFHFDCFWMRAFRWIDLEWDPAVFPDPAGMLTRLKERGLRISAWINSYVGQASSLFEEGKENGYFLKRPNGDVWQWDMWQPGMAIIDFTNPAATAWFQEKLGRVLDAGVDSIKTDFGERIPTDVVYFDGSDPERMHNYYTQLYNQAVFDLLQEKRGPGEAVLFARSATAGGQRFPIHWGGDCWSEFEAMADSLRGGLSLCLSGFGFWSHDIGGFEGLPPAALYKRWVAFGLLSTHSRLHGSTSYRVPWLYDDEACDTLRFFTKLKCRLMPYLFAKAVETHETGVPMLRAMMLEFPGDPTAELLDRQYMLGDALLVAPVFAYDDTVQYYVPEGTWTSILDGRVQEGPGWKTETHGFLSLPVLARPNSLIALGSVDVRPDYDYADGLEFEAYALSEGAPATAVVYHPNGTWAGNATVTLTGERIEVAVSEGLRNWAITFVGRTGLRSDDGVVEETLRGARFRPNGSGAQVLHLA